MTYAELMAQTFGNLTMLERVDVGLPLVVHTSNGITKRPLLRKRIPQILCHYTGVPVSTRRYAKMTIPMLGSTITSIHRWRANEYNYVIPQMLDGKPLVVEFAGTFQAAHCGPFSGKSWNPNSYGVLFLNSVEEPITWSQIEAFGWLKNLLRWVQAVEQNVLVDPHSIAKPTGCPGPSINEAMDGLRKL